MSSDLFAGLVKGFGGTVLQQRQQEHEDAVRNTQTELEVLRSAAADPNLSDDGRRAVWGKMIDLGGGKKGGKQNPIMDSLSQILGMHPSQAGTGTSSPHPDDLGKPTSPPAGAAPPQTAQPAATQVTDDTQGAGSVPTPPAPPQSSAPAQNAPQAAAAPPVTSGAVPQPPAPPSLFLTHQQALQRQMDDASTKQKAVDAQFFNSRKTTYADTIQAYKDAHNGEEPDDDFKSKAFENAYGLKADKETKKIISKDTFKGPDGNYYHNIYDSNFQVVGHAPAEAPKANKYEQAIQDGIQNWKSVNSPKVGESPEDYTHRAEQMVRKQAYQTNLTKLANLGAGVQLKQAHIAVLQKQLQSGSLTPINATRLWRGAQASARQRMSAGAEAPGTTVDQLIDDELGKIGTSRAEISSALGAGSKSQAGTGKYKYTATNPQTGARMGSNDGVHWNSIAH